MSKHIIKSETDYGTFNFEFNAEQSVFIERAINDVIFNQCSWLSAELIDFAKIFNNVSIICVKQCLINDNKELLVETLKDKKFIAIVFYTSEMQVVTHCLNTNADSFGRAKFLKAFHPETGKTLHGEFVIFYEKDSEH